METETTDLGTADDQVQAEPADDVLADELIEDVSIDGMCGVY